MIEPLTRKSLMHVLENLRERDAAEAYAVTWGDKPEDIENMIKHLPGAAFIATAKGEPVAFVGHVDLRPHVCTVFMLATDRWPEVALEVTKFIKRFIIPQLVKMGMHRAECQSLADYHKAHKWLKMLGARQEGATLRNFGKNGEDFITFVWLAENGVLLSDKNLQI